MSDLLRVEALRAAVEIVTHPVSRVRFSGQNGEEQRDETVIDTAERFLVWLLGPTSIRLHAGPIHTQKSGHPSGTHSDGGTMQLHDNEQFTLSADTQDAKGFETADTLTWTADDESVVTLQVSDDTKSCTVVAGNPGSAVITVTDRTLSATEAVDVITGDTAAIVLNEGPVTVQGE